MEAAKILHERGHEVTLFEATNQLGGEFLLAGEAPGKAEMKSAAMEMAAQVEKLVTVHKNTKVDAQMLEQADVDAVILAIGSSPITINLEEWISFGMYLHRRCFGMKSVRKER